VAIYPSKQDYCHVAKPSPSHSGDPVLLALGSAIRRYRADLGLAQETLALQAGIDRSYLGGIERGEHNLAVINLAKIAKALNTTPSNLLGLSGN
jgi:transcriptional regulator with XRE-family HTH domain